MPLVNAKCTSCGATLEVDSSKEALVCKYCGSAFVVEQAINNYNITNNVTNNINAQNVTIINQVQKEDFEIEGGFLKKYTGKSPDVVIPEGVTFISKGAFPPTITSVTIPSSIYKMQESAFKNCLYLTTVTFAEGATVVPAFAFQDCLNLTTVNLPGSVKTIEMYAFARCKKLTTVNLSEGLTDINMYAFCGCDNLTSIILPETLETIETKAFLYCRGLTSITIPKNVKQVHSCAFESCFNLKEVVILGEPKMAELFSIDSPFFGTQYEKDLKKQKNGCYVATCVYGSYDCPAVWTLRRYRDNTLAETWYGRAFIHTYYAVSPTIVKLFGETEWFKKMWRGKLDRMVADLQAKGVENTPYEDRNW